MTNELDRIYPCQQLFLSIKDLVGILLLQERRSTNPSLEEFYEKQVLESQVQAAWARVHSYLDEVEKLARKGSTSFKSEAPPMKHNYFQQMLEHHEALANYYRDFLRKGD